MSVPHSDLGAYEQWLLARHFDRAGVQLAFDEALDAVFTISGLPDRPGYRAIEEMAETRRARGERVRRQATHRRG